jgi:hypothetical protein
VHKISPHFIRRNTYLETYLPWPVFWYNKAVSTGRSGVQGDGARNPTGSEPTEHLSLTCHNDVVQNVSESLEALAKEYDN